MRFLMPTTVLRASSRPVSTVQLVPGGPEFVSKACLLSCKHVVESCLEWMQSGKKGSENVFDSNWGVRKGLAGKTTILRTH